MSLGHAGVAMAVAASGIVFFEPAPYDLALPLVMLVMLLGGLRIPGRIAPLIVLLAVFIAGGFASAALARHGAGDPVRHFAITAYLAASAIFFAAYVAPAPVERLERIFKAWCLAALIAAGAAVAGYFDVTGQLDQLVLHERARGTFKDPNVLGPFLVAPALYAAMRAMTGRFPGNLGWFAFASLAAFAVLLTFSRGAWGHLAISAAVMVYLMALTARDLRDRFQLMVLSCIAVLLAAGAVTAAMSFDAIGGLLEQRASLTQSYDTGETGRFGRQVAAIGLILGNPGGIGFGEFERIFPEAPHNAYLNAFIIAGWAGGFAYVGLVVASLLVGFGHILRRTSWQPYMIVVYATFVGMAVEGLVIDSDHWRHFYLLTGLMWGMFAAAWRLDRTRKQSQKPSQSS